MKNMFRFSALLCAMAVLVTSCTQDETLEPQVKPAADGSEIMFGARAGFENAGESRTEYSGVDYTHGGKNYERIDWTFDTDQIEIYSPNTANSNNTYYQVKNAGINPDGAPTEGETSDHLHDYAYLQRMSDSGNLQWNGDGDHTFYAMYPSERMFDEPASEANGWVGTTVEMGIEMNKEVLTGVIPNVQTQTYDEDASDANTFVFKPDMRFAYMAAKTTTNRAKGNVGLTFVPLVTAVEVELTFPDDGNADQKFHDVMVGEIEVTTKSNDSDTNTQPLAGWFTANLKDWDGATSPAVSVVEGAETSNAIQLSTYKWNSEMNMDIPVTLNEGQSLKFTVFLLPNQAIDDLCIKFAGTGGETMKGKTLTDTQIPAGLKTRITKVKLPTVGIEQENPFEDRSNWMGDLNPLTEFRRLSLPGTGGSFSYNYTEDDRAEYAEQYEDMYLEKQWNLGIRAFEVIVNRPEGTDGLGAEQVKCNKTPMGTDFDTVMKDLTDWVSSGKYPNECAVVILTYQPEDSSPNRNCESFASELHAWYEDFANKTILKKYRPDLTIGEAKGHVMVLVRANQTDEKDGGTYANAANTLADDPFVLINGAGTAKDRWGARGYNYTTKTTRTGNISGNTTTTSTSSGYFPHISNSQSGASIIETYMQHTQLFTTIDGDYSTSASGSFTDREMLYTYTYDYSINRAEPGNPDQLKFGFYTGNDNAETENATICWFQEWHRVVADPVKGNSTLLGGLDVTWFESYYEKLDNAKTTYDMAISGDSRYTNYIFVNSLCGYLAEEAPGTTTSTGSEYGGSGGNYAGLAEKINPAFYQYVYQRSQENTQGPTGIVMMDYVTDDSSLPHYYLPGLIIANNRKTGNVK